ncbi:MAG: YmdB family metallophosphoesterase [Treponema sp.]|nr:YmdB family metallophosphoesterase [Treponema sp.]
MIKVVMFGDVMGEAGLKVLEEKLPAFITEQKPAFIMINGENSANGFGISEETLKRMLNCGADVISSGNHIWEKRDFWPFLDSEERVLRPANYPQDFGAGPIGPRPADQKTPGRGWKIFQKNIDGSNIGFLAINLQGRELMYNIECPFRCFDAIEKVQTQKSIVLVDFHAESSKEKEAFGFYLDGRAAVVAGTHTHVQTADEKILPKGTAYITDLGMTGVKNSVIGMEPKICIDRARNQVLYRMEAAADSGSARIQGIIAGIDETSGKAVTIERLNID